MRVTGSSSGDDDDDRESWPFLLFPLFPVILHPQKRRERKSLCVHTQWDSASCVRAFVTENVRVLCCGAEVKRLETSSLSLSLSLSLFLLSLLHPPKCTPRLRLSWKTEGKKKQREWQRQQKFFVLWKLTKHKLKCCSAIDRNEQL